MLTDREIKTAQFKEKPYRIYDINGLHVLIRPPSSKSFFMRYTFSGKRRELSIGKYPNTSLKAARLTVSEYHALIAQGKDPYAIKHDSKAQKKADFKTIAKQWLKQNKTDVIAETAEKIAARLENHVYKYIATRPVSDLRTPDIKLVLDALIVARKFETAERCRGYISNILCYAIMSGLCEFDVTTPLKGYVKKPMVNHRPALIALREIAPMLKDVWSYHGSVSVRYALRFSAYAMLRPKEVRFLEWSEIEWERDIIEIPADKMKMKRPHIVPLTNQIKSILKEMFEFKTVSNYVFSVPGKINPLSENTVNDGLKKMGYQGKQCAHGFRGTASTLLYEMDFNGDHIEMQLAHVEEKDTKAAYNHARFLKQRRKMLQHYCDFLDDLRAGAIPFDLFEE